MGKKKRVFRFIKFAIFLGILYLIGSYNDFFLKPVFSRDTRAKHLIVISVDGLVARDYEKIKELPNFKYILENGSLAEEVTGVYPSLTYPSHASIITGTYPDKHGIFANEVMEPEVKNQKWFWYDKDIKVPTLYDLAREAHMKVGSIFWPVTAGANINYNCPEIWTVKEGQNQTLLSLKNGSPFYLYTIDMKYGNLRDGIKQPNLDNFAAASSVYTIKAKKPNLLLVHFTELDYQRHYYGVDSKEASDALIKMDERIGKILQAARDAEIFDKASFVVLGDHGFLDTEYTIALNTLLVKEGLITLDASGNVSNWKAYSNYCDGSAQIKIKDKSDIGSYMKVQELLLKLENDPLSGIEKVYTKDEAAGKRVVGNFDFMVEAKKGYYFINDCKYGYLIKIDKGNINENSKDIYPATHGYDPLKQDYKTIFMACGAGIKRGVWIKNINLVDEGPTMAEILGLKFDMTDGRVLSEMLENR